MKKIALGLSVLCSIGMPALSETAQAGQVAARCIVMDVATFANRVHINCPILAPLNPGVSAAGPYFAVEATSPMATNVVQVAVAAMINKRWVRVFFDDNAGVNPAGCNQNDCRRLIGLLMQ